VLSHIKNPNDCGRTASRVDLEGIQGGLGMARSQLISPDQRLIAIPGRRPRSNLPAHRTLGGHEPAEGHARQVLPIMAQREPASLARTGLERHEAGGEFGGRNRHGGQILLAVSDAWARGPTAVQWPTAFATAWTSQQIRSHHLAVRVLLIAVTRGRNATPGRRLHC
jgi:hypothetical protein